MSETYTTKCFRVIFPKVTIKILVSIHHDRRTFSLLSMNPELQGATFHDCNGELIGSMTAERIISLKCRRYDKIPVFSVKNKDGLEGKLEEFEPEGNGREFLALNAR